MLLLLTDQFLYRNLKKRKPTRACWIGSFEEFAAPLQAVLTKMATIALHLFFQIQI